MALTPDIIRAAIGNLGGTRFQQHGDAETDVEGNELPASQGAAGGDADAVSANSIQPDPGREGDSSGEEAALGNVGTMHDKSVDLAPPGVFMPPDAAQTPQSVMYGHLFQPMGGPDAVHNIDRATQLQQQAVSDWAKAQKDANNAAADIQQDTRFQLEGKYLQNELARQADHAEARARIAELQKEADRIGKVQIDQGRAFRNPVGFLGGIFMALTPLFTHRPTGAAEAVNKIINRDIDVQVQDLKTQEGALNQKRGLFAEYMALMKDEDQARLMAESKMKEIAAMKLNEVATRMRNPLVDAQAKNTAATLMLQANELRMRVFAMAYRNAQNVPEWLAKSITSSEPGKAYYGNSQKMNTTDQMGQQVIRLAPGQDIVPGETKEMRLSNGNTVTVSADKAGNVTFGAPKVGAQGAPAAQAPQPAPLRAPQAAAQPKPGGKPVAWGSMPAPTADQIFGTEAPPQQKFGKSLLSDFDKSLSKPAEGGQISVDQSADMLGYKPQAPNKGEATGGFKQLTAYPVTQHLLTKYMQDNPIKTLSDAPSMRSRLIQAREVEATRAAADYINGMSELKSGQLPYYKIKQTQGKAFADAAAAGYAAHHLGELVKDAQSKAGAVMKEWRESAGDQAMIKDVKERLDGLVQALGSEEKVEEMFGWFNVAPKTSNEFFQIAKKMGWQQDKRTEAIADLMVGLQAEKLKIRHAYAGVSVNPNESANIDQFFTKSMSVHSIREALRFIGKDYQARYNLGIGAAGGSEFAMLMLAGMNGGYQGGTPSSRISPSPSKPSPNAHLYE